VATKSKSRTSEHEPSPAAGGLDQAAPGRRASARLLAAALLVLVGLVVWAHPRPVADMYVGLAGGRDIAEGHLGRADDWSFLTEGRVWIDQNWLTHLLYYRAFDRLGEAGLLATKAAMIGLLMLGVVELCRARGASWAISLLTAAGVVLAAKTFIDLRPNLVTLMLAPWLLVVLLQSRRQVHWIWLALPILLAWTNMHGGFTFGLGLVGLWAACQILCEWAARGLRAALRRYWPLAAATAVSVAIAAFANPFGPTNLVQALIVGRSAVWRQVLEWRSIFDPVSAGPSFQGELPALLGALPPGLATALYFHWPLLTVLGLTLVLSTAHLLIWQRRRRAGRAPSLHPTAAGVAAAFFESIVLVLVVTMAISAQRFSPLAMLMAAPFLSRQLDWLLTRRPAWLFAAACLLVLLPAATLGLRVARHYSPANPVADPESFLSRMVTDSAVNPGKLCQFINDNHIEGRIFQEWAWEGYMHWKCPALKLWIGARAQQVYTEQKYRQRLDLLTDANGVIPKLNRLDIHLAAVSAPLAEVLLPVLAHRPGSTWAVIYVDGLNVLLADYEYPATRSLVDAAAAGRLSRAVCLTCTPILRGGDGGLACKLLRQSIARQACPLQVLSLVALAARPNGALEESDAQFLADQYNHYAAAHQPQARGSMIVGMCSDMAKSLEKHYRLTSRLVEAHYWQQEAARQQRLLKDMRDRWTMR
jgi:hypothetical protein